MTTVHGSLWKVSFVVIAFSGFALGQTTAQNPTNSGYSQAQQIAEAIVKTNNGWGEKLNASGAVLTVLETGRANGRISYRLHAEGLPKDHIYSLIQWPVTQRQPIVALQGVTINSSGIAVCAGRAGTCGDASKPDDPIDLQTAPVLGEPLRFALAAQDDKNLRAAIKLVPIPNFGVDQGCRVDAVLLTPHAELISIEASGFPTNTEVALTQDAEGEVHNAWQKIDGTGKLSWAVMPAKAGLKHGSVKIQVKAPGCSPQVSVAWGSR